MTCPICDDDGWVDIPDEETGGVLGPMECPRLDEPGHAPFNANGLLDKDATVATAIAPEQPLLRQPNEKEARPSA